MRLGYCLLDHAVKAVFVALPVVERIPGAGIVLDIVLGPAEDFDYVSTTSPPVTPPTQ